MPIGSTAAGILGRGRGILMGIILWGTGDGRAGNAAGDLPAADVPGLCSQGTAESHAQGGNLFCFCGQEREELMRGGSEPRDNVSSLGWGSALRSSQILVDRRNVWISCLVAHLLQPRQTGTCLSHGATNNLLGAGKSPAGFLCRP